MADESRSDRQEVQSAAWSETARPAMIPQIVVRQEVIGGIACLPSGTECPEGRLPRLSERGKHGCGVGDSSGVRVEGGDL
jgi:hypothetical protein